MGVRVLYDGEQRFAALYDSVSGFAFGPMFGGWDDACLDPSDEAECFLVWLDEVAGVDARQLTDDQFVSFKGRWHDALAKIGTTTSDESLIVRLAIDYDTAATMRGTDGTPATTATRAGDGR